VSVTVVTLRKLAEGDWQAMRAARLAALAEAPYAFASTLAREEAFTDEIWRERAGSGRTFGAWHDGVIVGLATGFPEEPPTGWHLVGMWVAPAHRGQGIADHLVGAIRELAKDAGAVSVTLWVADANDRARAFYRRLGFMPTGQRQLLRPGEWEEELSLPV
jgi:ribosomal protein S18 acetylase RimI-like enzyme